MQADEVRALADNLGVGEILDESRIEYLQGVLLGIQDQGAIAPEPVGSPSDLAAVLERLAIDAEETGRNRQLLFQDAYTIRRGSEYGDSELDRMVHYACLAADGILGERQAEISLLLREETRNLQITEAAHSWPNLLLLQVAKAFILLCRKSNGWRDVQEATSSIDGLRELQSLYERTYVQDSGSQNNQLSAVGALITLYNLAKIVDIVAQYTISGTPIDALLQLDRHASNIEQSMEHCEDGELLHLADLVIAASRNLIRGSIWFGTRALGQNISAFLRNLVADTQARPVFDLWPSQRTALTSGLLDPAKRAIVVEMPTSAGKTLIAEFSIIQALALNPGSRVAYVVPTRALVNQISIRLRRDISPLGYTVEAAVPVFEIDPVEDALLQREISILVLTPEKLDLLIRTRHEVVDNLSLVVADEAHNLQDGERGARLELLLATLKRERADTRFLLLTPFIPNADVIATWLGDSADSAIKVDWRPSERITAAATWEKPRRKPYNLNLTTLPSVGNVDVVNEATYNIGLVDDSQNRSVGSISASITARLAGRGAVLVLCRDRSRAEERAATLVELAGSRGRNTPFQEAVANFAAAELGSDHELPEMLRQGIAYHHAGLPHDLRFLIEALIDTGDISIICGTTTLAQGVNFPIASVVVESLSVPLQRGARPLSYAEFWNIAGRAGRAMRDRLGFVIFPVDSTTRLNDTRAFLAGEADALASALLGALIELPGATQRLNLGFVRNNRTISIFLQYLTHALRVAGRDLDITTEIEDLLRSSLVYHQARSENREAAERLIRLARQYLQETQGRDRGYLSLADGTGFSLYSVDLMYSKYRNSYPELATPSFWATENLFGGDAEGLSAVVEVLADVPELTLGTQSHGTFSPERVAGIIQDWVRGETANEIADRWFSNIEPDEKKRRRLAGHYLNSRLLGQIPWGLGALQRLALGDRVGESSNASSLIFYGVPTTEAATLRMAGVPRIAAEGLAQLARNDNADLSSFGQMREWIAHRTPQEWASTLPSSASLTGDQCQSLWTELSGEPAVLA